MKLVGHHVFITGGASGIGLALAREFQKSGNRVTVCGRDDEKLKRAVQENQGLEAIKVDITQDEGLRQIEKELEGRLRTVSILINNAAIGNAYCFLRDQDPVTKIEAELSTNLLSPIRLTRAFLPILLAHENAAVVNITSGFAAWPCSTLPGYSVSKSGLKAFTRVLRNQLKHTSVKVFEVLPPMVETDMVKDSGARKISPQKVVAATFAGMRKNRGEICIGEVRLIRFFAGLLPGFLDWVLRRYPVGLKELDRVYRHGNDGKD